MAGPDRSNTPAVVVVVAIVGLLATIGASALGGYWANKSVERQLESERSTAIQDQRREVYVDYLTSALRVCDTWARALGDGSVDQGDPGKLQAAEIDVLNQEGRVLLIAGTDLRQAVGTFTDKLLDGQPPTACDNNNAFLGYRDAFIDGAKPDLE